LKTGFSNISVSLVLFSESDKMLSNSETVSLEQSLISRYYTSMSLYIFKFWTKLLSSFNYF